MLSQSEALRFEEVFSKFAGKEFSDRIAQEEIQEALAEMKANPASEGFEHGFLFAHIASSIAFLPELKGLLAEVEFEARDGLSIDQFILASPPRRYCRLLLILVVASCSFSAETGG